MSLPCTLPYVCECPLGLSLVSYRTWLSFPSDLLHVSLPFILPYVSEIPHCHTVREWVSPVTYCTWVFPLSLCTLVNFHSILQCVSFPSVLLHVCKFPYWSTLREFQCLTVREFPYCLTARDVWFPSVLPYVSEFPQWLWRRHDKSITVWSLENRTFVIGEVPRGCFGLFSG